MLYFSWQIYHKWASSRSFWWNLMKHLGTVLQKFPLKVSEYLFFLDSKSTFFFHKDMENPYLNLNFKFHDFFPWNNEVWTFSVSGFLLYEHKAILYLGFSLKYDSSIKKINYVNVIIFKDHKIRVITEKQKEPEGWTLWCLELCNCLKVHS